MDNITDKDKNQINLENLNNPSVGYASYSEVDENGTFLETCGYSEENEVYDFFKSLSEEELEEFKRL